MLIIGRNINITCLYVTNDENMSILFIKDDMKMNWNVLNSPM